MTRVRAPVLCRAVKAVHGTVCALHRIRKQELRIPIPGTLHKCSDPRFMLLHLTREPCVKPYKKPRSVLAQLRRVRHGELCRL